VDFDLPTASRSDKRVIATLSCVDLHVQAAKTHYIPQDREWLTEMLERLLLSTLRGRRGNRSTSTPTIDGKPSNRKMSASGRVTPVSD
jgi:hypothetical protein